MKNFSNLIFTVLLVVSTFAIVSYTSCNKDKCKNITCKNGGTCTDGICKCINGYKGTLCETPQSFCDTAVCLNGGTCSTNICNCTAGYEGINCEKAIRAKYLRSWLATDHETDNIINIFYSAAIQAGTTVTEIRILNFHDYFANPVIATISGNTITVASQSPDNNGRLVQGVATYKANGGYIEWIYTITNPPAAAVAYSGIWTTD